MISDDDGDEHGVGVWCRCGGSLLTWASDSGVSGQVCEVVIGDEVEFSECVVVCEGEAGDLLGEDLCGICAVPDHSTQHTHHLLTHLRHTQPESMCVWLS